MKRVLLTLMLCMILAVTMSSNAFALEIDYDLVSIPNDGPYEDVTIDYSKEGDVLIGASNGIRPDFPETNEKGKSIVRIYADGNTYIGTGTVQTMYLNEKGQTDVAVIYVNVYDNSKPDSLNVVKSGSNVKLTWESTSSFYYQIQYRVKNGKWKTAESKYDITPKLETNGRAYTFKNLKKGKTYQFRLRPVTPSYEWGTEYGKWSDTFTYTVK